jgi:hypothetical protein
VANSQIIISGGNQSPVKMSAWLCKRLWLNFHLPSGSYIPIWSYITFTVEWYILIQGCAGIIVTPDGSRIQVEDMSLVRRARP